MVQLFFYVKYFIFSYHVSREAHHLYTLSHVCFNSGFAPLCKSVKFINLSRHHKDLNRSFKSQLKSKH